MAFQTYYKSSDFNWISGHGFDFLISLKALKNVTWNKL